MSSEPGNESFFCGLRPIPRILRLQDEIARVNWEGWDEIAEVKRVEAEAAAAHDRNDADALDRLWAQQSTPIAGG